MEGGVAGLFLDDGQFAAVSARDAKASRKRTKSREMLRQRCEEEGLHFEPVPAPPARARHAVVWVAIDAVAAAPHDRPFNARFLNIASPWSDPDLRDWTGYTRTLRVGRRAARPRPAPGARPVPMIPLAVYGLDFPKIPALLVDFRSVLNAKGRELSRRVVDDVGRYVLDVSPFGDVYFYAVQSCYATITGRRGIDLNQPSRLKSYAQLRSLLVLKDVFDPELRAMVERDLGRLDLNPPRRASPTSRPSRLSSTTLWSSTRGAATSTAASSATAPARRRGSRTAASRPSCLPSRGSRRSASSATATTRPRCALAAASRARSSGTHGSKPTSRRRLLRWRSTWSPERFHPSPSTSSCTASAGASSCASAGRSSRSRATRPPASS